MAKRGRKSIEDLYPAAYKALRNINLLKAAYGTTDNSIAQAAGMSLRTLQNRKKAPWLFTIGELHNIADIYGLTENQLLTELKIVGEES